MANIKDPKKSIPDNLVKDNAGKAPTAGKPRDDFSFDLNNFYRISDEKQDDLRNLDATRFEEAQKITEQLSEQTKLLSADDLEKMGKLTVWDLLRVDPSDERAMSMRVGEITNPQTGEHTYVVGKEREQFEARRAAETYLRTPSNMTENAPQSTYRVTSIGNGQAELVNSVDRIAKLTNVPPALLGAMAGIESGFNDPKMQKSPTGAIGVMQQTGGYRTTMWEKFGDKIAQHVPEARDAMANGLTKNEMRGLAYNTDAALMMVALRAKELEKKYNLDLNNPKSWGVIYLEHNSGEGSVKRLLNGQMTDAKIREYNPAIYRGADTPQEVLANTQKKMMTYADRYEQVASKVEEKGLLAMKPEADAAIGKASIASAREAALAASNADAKDIKNSQAKGPAPIPS